MARPSGEPGRGAGAINGVGWREAREMKQSELNVDRVFQALGDGTRRAMLERLSPGPMSVSLLAAPFKMSLAAVVQHLQVLEESGLVKTEKTGRVRSCRV